MNLATLALFTPDEPACSEELGRRILVAYVFWVSYSEGDLLPIADTAMRAHGVGPDSLASAAIARAVRTERRGLSLLHSLERMREALNPWPQKERTV
jgi:hypothetical protein